MNLMGEDFKNETVNNSKKVTRIILIAIIVLVIMIIGIIIYLLYIESSTLKLTIDGVSNENLKKILVFENDGTIYAPIKEIASYFGYESYSGEYSSKSEEQSKCYVQSENEVANFELGETTIYKLDLSKENDNYEYVSIENPVKAINSVLYISTEGLEKAFNISFQYNEKENQIAIYTLPYLAQYYNNIVLNYGYTSLKEELVNQKAILKDQLIVKKEQQKEQYGVIKSDGTPILEPKYDNITYLPNTGDFLVETDKKVGILSANKETKVQIIYDSIELISSELGLYLAKKDNKYGVIDIRGNIKIYIENDEIGVDISQFTQNNIKNKYLLANKLIPVRKDKYWGLYDVNGKQVTDFKYDAFGYIASNNNSALNLLLIPDYNVLVACKDKKYTLINTSGKELFDTVADEIYMTISGGERHYYITLEDQKIDAVEILEENGITVEKNSQTNNNSNQTKGDEE